MKTESQLKDLSLWEKAESGLATAVAHLSDLQLLSFAAQLSTSTNELAPLAVFAVMFEVHRRAQDEHR